jgi:Raf kinase inhibitor-like YbhB/YbcL family protein
MPSRLFRMLTLATFVASVGVAAAQQPAGAQGGGRGGGRGPQGPGLTLTSTAWPDGGEIPAKYAGGMGVSPALTWSNAPMGTVEFVLVMNDPEPVRPALSVSGDILHWLVVKIPASATSLPEGAGAAQSTTLPAGARQVQTYRGPGAPAAGPRHHYTLTLYALNAPLELAENADRAAVMAAMEGKVLARGIFNGRFMQAPAQ